MKENEIWKDIPEYEGYYQASNLGRIRSVDRISIMKDGRSRKRQGCIIKSELNNSGYKLVHLYIDGKRSAVLVHRMIALTFIENKDNKAYVNHVDCNKQNNELYNLEWCTGFENMKHAVDNGLFVAYKRTTEQRKNISIRMSKTHKGVKKSADHCRIMSEQRKGRPPKCMTERKRKDFVKVICVNTGEIFPTIKDAADSIGVNKNKLWRHLRYGTIYPSITLTFKIISNVNKTIRRKKQIIST